MLLNRKTPAPTPLTLKPTPRQAAGPSPRPTPPPVPTVEYVEVSPELATRWLGYNTGNRTIRAARVNQYARDMAEGRWTIGADLVCFDPDGHLLNGQHRLAAIVQAGVSVMLVVQWDTPRTAMPNMDNGSGRSAADLLTWNGESSAALLASSAKLAALWRSGLIYGDNQKRTMSHGSIAEFIDANPSLRQSTNFVSARKSRFDCQPTPMVVAHWGIADASGRDDADSFVTRIVELTGEPKGSPVLALNSRLREIRRARMKVEHRVLLALVIRAWNADTKGRAVTAFPLYLRGQFVIPEPLATA